jgi:hypothetical protein
MATARAHPPPYFEYRYFIHEELSSHVRDFVGEYMSLDQYSVGRPDYSYTIDDFYFDSDQWRIYWRLIDVAAQSLQARLRLYSHRPEAPVYCETKRRANDRVEKQRVAVPRSAVPWLMVGQLPDLPEAGSDPEDRIHLERFCQFVASTQAQPRVHVSFLREAYVAPGQDAARLTIDRRMQCELLLSPDIALEMARPAPMFHNQLMLEVKFPERPPGWAHELVRRFGLRPSGAIKFVESVRLVAGPSVSGSDTTFF